MGRSCGLRAVVVKAKLGVGVWVVAVVVKVELGVEKWRKTGG